MYSNFADDVALTDATSQPVVVSNLVDANIGTPPSVNPALIDPNSGALIPSAVPIPPPPSKLPMYAGILLSTLLTYWLMRPKKKK